jgi:multisubunit Na+/H+ antiporter MnhG subunit
MSQLPSSSSKSTILRPMEKVMLGMTAFFLLGVAIYSLLPSGQIRGMGITAYVVLFVMFLYNPFGVKDKRSTQK